MAKIGDIFVRFRADTKDFEKGTAKVEKGLGQTENKIKGFSAGLKSLGGAVAGAFAIGAVVKFGKEVAELAGKAEGVSAAFMNIADASLLDELRKATRGTVDDLQLMQAAVRADNFKIPLDQMGKLLAFANDRAAQTGESVDYLVNSIIMGIGRKSPLILDNLGISAVELRQKLGSVSAEAATVGDVAAVVGQIAEEQMAKMGDVATTSAQKFASWKATMTNLKVEMGKGVNKALNALAPLISKVIAGAIKGFTIFKNAVVDVINGFVDLFNESEAFRVLMGVIGATVKTLFGSMKLAIKNVVTGWKTLGKVIAAAFKGQFKEIPKIIKEGFTEGIDDVKEFGKKTGENFVEGIKTTKAKRLKSIVPGDKEIQSGFYNAGLNAGNALGEGVRQALTEMKPMRALSEDKKALEKVAKEAQAALERAMGTKMTEPEKRLGNGLENVSSLEIDYSNNIQQVDLLADAMENLALSAKSMGEDIMQAGISSEGTFKEFGKTVINIVRKTIAALIAQGITSVVAKALTSVPFPFNLAIAGAAGGTAAALFNTAIPAFANGGIAFGPTIGAFGEYANARTNPEVIAPLDKLKTMMNTNVSGSTKISGNDLYIIWERENDFRNRT